MSRAEKRRKHREAQKAAKKGNGIEAGGQWINLQNPQRENFGPFILRNAVNCEKMVQARAGWGKTLVICGAGPTLRDHAAEYCAQADEVWGCNSAATWLYNNGHKITHAFTVDQQPHMIKEWYSAPPIRYILASTVHPHLVEYLLEKGRDLTFFHNFVGLQGPTMLVCTNCDFFPNMVRWFFESVSQGDEDALLKLVGRMQKPCGCPDPRMEAIPYENLLYGMFYDPCAVAGAGLNTVTRAIDIAGYMGFDKIQVLGADCAIRVTRPRPDAPFGSPAYMKWLEEGTEMHADGGSAIASEATAVTLFGDIDGREWETKPDLIISAVWLVKMVRAIPQLELIGDTLPNALMDKDDDFLFNRLPSLQGPNGETKTFDLDHTNYNFKERV